MREAELIASLIYMAHYTFGLDYEHMFDNCEPNKFFGTCLPVLGNYDDKLIRRYLLKLAQ